MSAVVGAALPPLVRPIDLTDMVAYAGATWDWHKLHYDTDYASARGLHSPIVDGQYFGALIVQMMHGWLGSRWRPARMSMRFSNPVYAGDIVRCEGVVRDASPDEINCDIRILVINNSGQDRLAVSPASVRMVRRT